MIAPDAVRYALSDEVNGASHSPRGRGCVSLYAPVRLASGSNVGPVALRRAGMRTFGGSTSPVVCSSAGLCTVQATSAPGNQTRYTYFLAREVAWIDRETRRVYDVAPEAPVIGLMESECLEVDPRPGLYYVSARDDSNPPRTACLLGPFERHLDALLWKQAAKVCVSDTHPGGWWWSFGTVRVSLPIAQAPVGKLNDVLLTQEDRARLATAPAPPCAVEGEGPEPETEDSPAP